MTETKPNGAAALQAALQKSKEAAATQDAESAKEQSQQVAQAEAKASQIFDSGNDSPAPATASNPVKPAQEKLEMGEQDLIVNGEERAYLMPSAPCSFVFKDNNRVNCPDGVIRTSNPDYIEELEAAVRAGNIYHYKGKVQSLQQLPPDIKIPGRDIQ